MACGIARSGSRRCLTGAITGVLLVTMASLPARADPLLEEATDFLAQVLLVETGVPAVIVAAVRGDATAIVGYGETAEGSGQRPNGRSMMRVGSITKAFTGQVLASLVADGTVALSDPAADHLDWGVDIGGAGRPVRLIDLATHSGGLPREVPHETGPEDDPFATITQEAFTAWLEKEPLLFEPGSAIVYSNFGFDLLSSALAEAAGEPYPKLLAERVTGPLALSDTTYDPSPEQRERLLAGHGFDGEQLADVPTGDVVFGSGGLYTTAEDMTKWLSWHIDRFGEEDAEVRLLNHAVYRPRDGLSFVFGMDESGHMDAMGLGWVVMMPEGNRPLILQKAGGLQGIFSYVAFAPTRGVGVFIAINKFDFGAAIAMAATANDFLAGMAPR